jgi:hypothetical protein
MGLVGWSELPGLFVEVGGKHQVKTDRGYEWLTCTSAGAGDARFVPIDPQDTRLIVVPWSEWALRITDLRD